MSLPKPDILEQFLHDVNVLEDDEIEAKYYTSGIALPRYPMPSVIGQVVYGKYAVYVSEPKGFDCVACYSFAIGEGVF